MNNLKSLFISFYFLIFFVFLSNYFPKYSYANSSYTAPSVNVNASIGSYYLNLSGFIAPYASIVLIGDGNILRTVVADSTGYFYITSVLVNKGLTNLCFDAVDVKRLGESYSCITIPPITGNYSKNDIFLPPTFGVQRDQINVGDNAIIWGYSMPNAKVTVYLSDGRKVTVTADNTGFYQVTFKIDKAGTYEFFADATFNNQSSLEPLRKANFLALSTAQQLKQNAANWLTRLINFLLNNPWAIILIILPLILLILLLLRKLNPSWFTWIDVLEQRLLILIPFREKKLHHAWFVGY